MSLSLAHKNRVASSKTTRGSQYPDRYVGDADIVQPAQLNTQPIITVEDVTRVLEIGKILRSVLTPDELKDLSHILRAKKQKRGINDQEELVTSMALDAEASLAEY